MFGIDINIIILAALVMVCAGGLFYGIFFQKVESDRRVQQRVNQVNSNTDRAGKLAAEARIAEHAKRRQSVQSSLKELEEKTRAKDPNKRGLADDIKQAGMTVNIRQFYTYSIVFGVIVTGLVFFLSGDPLATGAVFVIASFGLPRWFVGFKKKRRMNAFLEEFPNAVDVITRGIKAGLPLNDCIGIIANEAKEPVRTEFKKILETQKMGVPMTEAIQKLYRNVPLTEANFFGIVISIQQSAGGNLSEALSNLSRVLRDRKKMKAKIQAMSAEAKASAGIIGSLPFAVTVMIYLTTPDYISLLFTHETGNLILLFSGMWMGMGIMMMRSMINFDF